MTIASPAYIPHEMNKLRSCWVEEIQRSLKRGQAEILEHQTVTVAGAMDHQGVDSLDQPFAIDIQGDAELHQGLRG